MVPTPLSAWYECHYTSLCTHAWRHSDSAMTHYFVVGPFRIRVAGGSTGSCPTPAILSLDAAQRKELDVRYETDASACRKYIADSLRMRSFGLDP
jgi:hypothetical protein